MIQVDLSNIWGEVSLPELLGIEKELLDAHMQLTEGTGAGAAYRGWQELPDRTAPRELLGMLRAAEQIRADSDVCVVLGTDSGCTGARAAIALLQGCERNIGRGKGDPQIIFAGSSLSTRHRNELLRLLEGKDISLILVSESGTDPECMASFRCLLWMLERKYGTDECSRRIYVVTGAGENALQQVARDKQWDLFTLPSDVCAGFTVLSPAGLLPMAAAGIDIMAVLTGAAEAREQCGLRSFENPAWMYSSVRTLMYRQGKAIELLCSYEPGFSAFGRWWQQLFSGAEGKDGKGLFPATAEFPADLPSLGQLILDGKRNLTQTLVRFAPGTPGADIGYDVYDLGGLNCLADLQLQDVEETVCQETIAAHADAGVPVVTIDCSELNAQTLGELFYFFQLSCALCGYTQGVNPFEQPAALQHRQTLARQLGIS